MITIRRQIFSRFSIIAIVASILLMGWLLLDLEPRYREAIEEQLVDTSTVLSSLVSTTSNNQLDLTILDRVFADAASRKINAQIFEVEKNFFDLRVYVTDHQGKLLFDSTKESPVGSDYLEWRDVALTLKGEYGARTSLFKERNRNSMILFVASPIFINGDLKGILSVGKPLRGVSQFIYSARLRGALISCLILLAVLLATYFVAKSISGPIQELIKYTESVQENRNVHSPKFTTRELSSLMVAIEQMRKKIEGREYLQNMLEAFSHEMKSPVAAIQSAAEIISDDPPKTEYRRFSNLIREQASRITILLHKLLELARLENRSISKMEDKVDIVSIINELVINFDPIFNLKHVALHAGINEEYFVKGDPSQIATALSNLIQNALDFTPSGGSVHMFVERNESRILITVKDTGTGIPDYALGKIFDRYYSLERPDTKQKSTGLGLSIVQEIALLNRGDITVCNDPVGGCIATFTLSEGN